MDEMNTLRFGEGWAGVMVWPELLTRRNDDENDRGFAPVFGVACCISTSQGEMILASGCFRTLASMRGD